MTHSSISIVPASDVLLPSVVTLLLAQQARQHAQNPALRTAASRAEVDTALRARIPADALVVLNGAGDVRGYAHPEVWELKPTSSLRAFLTARNGVVSPLVLPHPDEPDAQAVVTALLSALDAFWRQAGTSGDLLRWPSTDGWFADALTAQVFQLDSICALRPLEPFFSMRPTAGPDQQVRLAQPEDEEALVNLFDEELRFHERYTPFVRSSFAVLETFRDKLKLMWEGDALQVLEAGAPVVLVVEQAGRVVAMAENTLLSVAPGDEPGYTPEGSYWCLDNVSVHEAFQGQGIGRLLVSTIEEVRQDLGVSLDGYLLWYNPDNPSAARFWPSLGFQPLWTTFQRLHQSEQTTAGI